jgi:hypothetical protein
MVRQGPDSVHAGADSENGLQMQAVAMENLPNSQRDVGRGAIDAAAQALGAIPPPAFSHRCAAWRRDIPPPAD